MASGADAGSDEHEQRPPDVLGDIGPRRELESARERRVLIGVEHRERDPRVECDPGVAEALGELERAARPVERVLGPRLVQATRAEVA